LGLFEVVRRLTEGVQKARACAAPTRGGASRRAYGDPPPRYRHDVSPPPTSWACPRGCAAPLAPGPPGARPRCARCGAEGDGPGRGPGPSASGSALRRSHVSGGYPGAVRPASRVGPYTLERELGRGANGVVYLARRDGLPRPVALKLLLHPESDPEDRERFDLEARVASKLRHPGVVGVFDAGQDAGRPYFVMEYVPGETLAQVLARGPLDPERAATLVAEVGRAVAYAHAEGVIHRDLKPANVVVSERDGRARITDFGLARDRSLVRSMTATGDVLGTPFTMAPEQIEGRRDVDRRADVYALGALLYRAVAGRWPYEAGSFPELAALVVRGGAPPPSARAPSPVPPEVDAVCARALAVDRRRRYATADDLVADLEAYLADPGAGRRVARARRLQLIAAGAGAALFALAGLAAAVGAGAGGLGDEAEAGTSSAASSPERAPAASPPGPDPATPRPDVPPDAVDSPSPGPSPRSPVADAAERAPDAEVEPLLQSALEVLRISFSSKARAPPRGVQLEKDRMRALADLFPEDSRAVFVGAVEAMSRDDLLAARRETHRALALGPELPEKARLQAAMISFSLGFERAGVDAVLARAERPGADPNARFLAATLLIKSHPPVADPRRSVALFEGLRRGLGERDPGPAGEGGPDAFMVLTHLGGAQLMAGDREGALATYTAARDLFRAGSVEHQGIGAKIDLIEAGVVRGRQAMARSSLTLDVTPFVQNMRALRAQADMSGDPVRAAATFEGQVDGVRRAEGPAEAALLLVQIARWYASGGRGARARRALESARGERLDPVDADVRALAGRLLARALIDAGRELARAEALALEVAEADRLVLTRAERADAWLLVARARRALGRADAAAEAAAHAEDAAPIDRRELEAFRRR